MDESEGTDDSSTWVKDTKAQHILKRDIDETDYRIYKALNDDGRMSDTELGKRVGLSRTAARRRRKKLQDKGIIDIISVIVLQEAELAHADVRVEFTPEASHSEIQSFISYLMDEELIYEIDEYMGKFDLLVRVSHVSLSDLKSYLREELQESSIIASYETTPVTKTFKAWNKQLDSFGDDESEDLSDANDGS